MRGFLSSPNGGIAQPGNHTGERLWPMVRPCFRAVRYSRCAGQKRLGKILPNFRDLLPARLQSLFLGLAWVPQSVLDGASRKLRDDFEGNMGALLATPPAPAGTAGSRRAIPKPPKKTRKRLARSHPRWPGRTRTRVRLWRRGSGRERSGNCLRHQTVTNDLLGS